MDSILSGHCYDDSMRSPPESPRVDRLKSSSIGWLPGLGLGLLLLAVAATLHGYFSQKYETRQYQVTADSRDQNDIDRVSLTIRRKPKCGSEAYDGGGDNGEGLVEHNGKSMEVIVEACVTSGEVVKLPDGRTLFLKELAD